jgi:hypothetical protein
MKEIYCVICNKLFARHHSKQKTCSEVCKRENYLVTRRLHWSRTYVRLGRNQKGTNNNAYKNGLGMYKSMKKSLCEKCQSTEKLCVHHIDHNRLNNNIDNLQTLCRRCHALEHDCVARLPKGIQLSEMSKRVKRTRCKITGKFIQKE